MKNHLLIPLLLLLFLAACKDEQEKPPTPTTKIILEVKKQSKNASGQKTIEAVPAIIHMWPAENCEFDVGASPDIHFGYAFDKASNSYKTMKYGAIGSRMSEVIKPGRYFVYVLLPKSSSSGSLAYSYTYFDIKEGENLQLSKTFSVDIGSGQYESWEKNK
jgi:hypothetical protein